MSRTNDNRIIQDALWRKRRREDSPMTSFKELYLALEEEAAKRGWTLAVGNQTQERPEQWPLVVTKEDPAKRLYQTLGIEVEEAVGIKDIFGGVDD